MNSWKKVAFVLALVAGLWGGAWAQGWGRHDQEQPREWSDNEDYRRGYREGLEYGRNDRNSGRKYQPAQYQLYKQGNMEFRRGWGIGYNEGFQGSTPSAHGHFESHDDYRIGYRDGLEYGRNDRRTGRRYQPAQYKAYKQGNEEFRRGWGVGYNEGFEGR